MQNLCVCETYWNPIEIALCIIAPEWNQSYVGELDVNGKYIRFLHSVHELSVFFLSGKKVYRLGKLKFAFVWKI